MAKGGSRDWLEAIAAKAKVEPDVAERVLDARGIRPSPVVATPRRLAVRRIEFSGVKTDVPGAGPFEFVWDDLCPGLWAMVTERNFRGKSSVIEIAKWLLRGRPSRRFQDDVRRWLRNCRLVFTLDGIFHEVRLDTPMTVSGRLVRFVSGEEIELAAFVGEAEFEAVMSDFFMKEFGLDVVARWKSGAEEDGGRTVLHGCADEFNSGTGRHIPPAQEGVTKPAILLQGFIPAPIRKDRRQQAGNAINVSLAIIEDVLPFPVGPGASGHNKAPHRLLLFRARRVQPEIGHGPQQATARYRAAPIIGNAPEFGIKVQHPCRDRPAKGEMAAEVCRGVIGDEKDIRRDRVGRFFHLAKLVPPYADHSVAPQFAGDQADGDRSVPLPGDEFKIHRPDLAVWQEIEHL